jgi:hypothetical protein
MFKLLAKLIKGRTEKDLISEYLSESADIVDLEHRLRRIERGQAPWQIQDRSYLQGWSY